MSELSNSVREKLDNPEVIKDISKYLLIKKGKINYDFSYMNISPPGIFPSFIDFPNKRIRISGDFSFSLELTSKLLEKIDNNTDSSLLQVFYNHFPRLLSEENLILNSLDIGWAKSPFVPDFKDLQKYKKESFLESEMKSFQKVFSYHGGESEILEKGEWQTYLAQAYASSLQFADLAKAEEGKKLLL